MMLFTAGNYIQAGLPNVVGGISADNNVCLIYSSPISNGALYKTVLAERKYRYALDTTAGVGSNSFDIGFDASRSNSIYGSSTTVQPSSVTVRYYIKY